MWTKLSWVGLFLIGIGVLAMGNGAIGWGMMDDEATGTQAIIASAVIILLGSLLIISGIYDHFTNGKR